MCVMCMIHFDISYIDLVKLRESNDTFCIKFPCTVYHFVELIFEIWIQYTANQNESPCELWIYYLCVLCVNYSIIGFTIMIDSILGILIVCHLQWALYMNDEMQVQADLPFSPLTTIAVCLLNWIDSIRIPDMNWALGVQWSIDIDIETLRINILISDAIHLNASFVLQLSEM